MSFCTCGSAVHPLTISAFQPVIQEVLLISQAINRDTLRYYHIFFAAPVMRNSSNDARDAIALTKASANAHLLVSHELQPTRSVTGR